MAAEVIHTADWREAMEVGRNNPGALVFCPGWAITFGDAAILPANVVSSAKTGKTTPP